MEISMYCLSAFQQIINSIDLPVSRSMVWRKMFADTPFEAAELCDSTNFPSVL